MIFSLATFKRRGRQYIHFRKSLGECTLGYIENSLFEATFEKNFPSNVFHYFHYFLCLLSYLNPQTML